MTKRYSSVIVIADGMLCIQHRQDEWSKPQVCVDYSVVRRAIPTDECFVGKEVNYIGSHGEGAARVARYSLYLGHGSYVGFEAPNECDLARRRYEPIPMPRGRSKKWSWTWRDGEWKKVNH